MALDKVGLGPHRQTELSLEIGLIRRMETVPGPS